MSEAPFSERMRRMASCSPSWFSTVNTATTSASTTVDQMISHGEGSRPLPPSLPEGPAEPDGPNSPARPDRPDGPDERGAASFAACGALAALSLGMAIFLTGVRRPPPGGLIDSATPVRFSYANGGMAYSFYTSDRTLCRGANAACAAIISIFILITVHCSRRHLLGTPVAHTRSSNKRTSPAHRSRPRHPTRMRTDAAAGRQRINPHRQEQTS